ncbi:choline dehydrogenase [Mesorhizobium sp. LNHC232B00]|nr:choline dehydrogenase [Mesorhizobium sp. LNHC232B00]
MCVLEAGPRDLNPLIHIPAGYIKNIYSKTLTWNFSSTPSPYTDNRSFSLPQGRVLGGSSSINGLNYVRGQRSDYDGWAQRGNAGWSYRDVLPYFKRSEMRIGPGDDRVRGRSGELPITDLDWKHPICEAFIQGAEQLGIPRNPDYNSGDQGGSGYFQRTIKNGFRYSAARAFLSKARKRKNVDIRTDSQAARIVFEGRRALGISYWKGGATGRFEYVHARREVILTAGALNTPKLMQMSGIGPADVIQAIGVPLVHELPGVGNNLRDHYGVRMVARLKNIRTINNMVQGPPLLLEMMRWAIGRPNLLAVSPSLVSLFWKSDPALDIPDLEYVFTPASFREGVVGLLDKFPGMTLGVWQTRPESLGYVKARSADPFEKPEIQPNYFSHEIDRRALLGGMRAGLKMLQTKPLQPWLQAVTAPAPDLRSDDELLGWARAKGITVYHMIGSARMAPQTDRQAVVDNELRVYGLEGLRVCDASVMPSMPSGNTNAPTMMIAEKAADMIRGRKLEPIDA